MEEAQATPAQHSQWRLSPFIRQTRMCPTHGPRILLKQFLIQRLPLVKDRAEAEVLNYALPRVFTHCFALISGSLHHPGHRGAEGSGIAGGRKPACLPINDDVAGSGNIGGHAGQCAGSRLQQAHRQTFPARRKNKPVGRLHPAPYIRLKAQELNPPFQSRFR